MNLEIFLGIVRHLLTFGGGTLVSKGLMEAGQAEQIIGAICSIIGVVWSIWHKRGMDRSGRDGRNGQGPLAISMLLIAGAMGLVLSGCATRCVEKTDQAGNKTSYRESLFFARSIVDKTSVDHVTKTTSTLLGVKGSETSVDAEGIDAATRMLKAGIEGAVAGAVKGVK